MTTPLNTAESLERIIARVIRDVLRESHGGSVSGEARHAAPKSPAAPPPMSLDAQPATLHLPDAVLSLDSLAGKLEGVRRLAVARASVVTPAVHDELRARGIELVRAGGAPPTAGSPRGGVGDARAQASTAELLLADADGKKRLAGLTRQLESRGLATPVIVDVETAIARVADAPAHAVVLAGLPQPVVCDACRYPRVRAAQVGSLAEVERVATAMRPNVWVLDMERLNFAAAVAAAAACFRVSPSRS